MKRPYLRGKQTQILRGQQRGNGSAKMISMQFIIFSTSKYWNEPIFDYYYYQFKLKYRINSFLMQELKLYMA